MQNTVSRWLTDEALTFSLRDPEVFDDAVDRMVEALPESLELLALGEPLHGGEEFLTLRNQLFCRLVEAHGYRAIAIESGLTRGQRVDDYVRWRSDESLESVLANGFDHGLGEVEANRTLLQWMRAYNEEALEEQRIGFHGFDLPTGTTRCQSPRDSLFFVLDYFDEVSEANPARRTRWDQLLGEYAPWEDPRAFLEPSVSPGDRPETQILRGQVEDLIAELERRRPELWDQDRVAYLTAYQHAVVGRALLNYHSALASQAGANALLGIRDALMADNLKNILEREEGKVLAFAHNSHLQSSFAQLPWYQWWPAGSHLRKLLGERYVSIAGALGWSMANELERPEKGSLEDALMELRSPAFLLVTPGMRALGEAGFPSRSGSERNRTYQPLTGQVLQDFEALIFLPTVSYTRGAEPLPENAT